MRRFFTSFSPSRSPASLSLPLFPSTWLCEPPWSLGGSLGRAAGTANPLSSLVGCASEPGSGVIGGVGEVRGGGIELDCVAATEGSLPYVGTGFVTAPPGVCANDDWVAIDDVELLLVGLAGRATFAGDGEGANAVAIDGCLGGPGGGGPGDRAVLVGVGIGEGCREVDAVLREMG